MIKVIEYDGIGQFVTVKSLHRVHTLAREPGETVLQCLNRHRKECLIRAQRQQSKAEFYLDAIRANGEG